MLAMNNLVSALIEFLFGLDDYREDDYIDRVSESFVRVFVNKYDYLFDYVAEGRSMIGA